MTRAARMLATGVALAVAPATPAHADDFFGVTPTDQLVRFDSLDPTARSPLPLTGLAAGEHVVAIDVRPATGGLYGIAKLGARLRLVRIDQATGALTQRGAPVNLPDPPAGVGMDVDPSDDAAQVITSSDRAFQFDLPTGAVTLLGPPDPATPQFVALAFTPDTGGIVLGASVDAAADRLALGTGSGSWVAYPNALGYDVGNSTSLDFATSTMLWMYADQGAPWIYRIDTITGIASQVLPVAPLTGLAVRLTGGVAFGAAAFGAGEGDGSVAVTLQREAPAETPAKVAWSTVDGTAVAGRDYTAASGEVTFARGQTRAAVTVPLTADTAVEGTERFGLRLTSVDGVPAGPTATVVVADDDVAGPPGPGGGGADTTAPALLALPVKRKPARSLKLPFATSEAGTATVTLRLRKKDAKRRRLGRTLASATFAATAGANTATLRLPRATVRKLAGRRLTATAAIVVTDGAGNRASATMKVKLAR